MYCMCEIKYFVNVVVIVIVNSETIAVTDPDPVCCTV